MDDALNSIRLGDCIEEMQRMRPGVVDLVFADPPFNIGYQYDVYDDSVEHQEYINWSKQWISAVYDVLKPTGTFWLAIGDEYAAELKLASQQIGFHCRSWVIWYYTFGVNCAKKFTRSHAHLFHFVKDPNEFTFRDEDLDNRVPSARELVYNDSRANPLGRLPDDTWIIRPADVIGELTCDDDASWSIDKLSPPSDDSRTYTLRPQDIEQSFQASEDTWYFPRVAGTFKERAGFHGCQMPEQLLGRIVRTCSNPGDTVLDPFSGSATTLAVAKKLARNYVGFDLSEDYVAYGNERLAAIRIGDRLDGSAEPLKSAPRTKRGTRRKTKEMPLLSGQTDPMERRYDEIQLTLTLHGVAEAFRLTHEGYSADRVVADPTLNEQFVAGCRKLGLVGEPRVWNTLLFRLRKSGKLSHVPTVHRSTIQWSDCDSYCFASEVAWQAMVLDGRANSIDEILCDPTLAEEFDRLASNLAPGFQPFEYRWVALMIRKQANVARSRAGLLDLGDRLQDPIMFSVLDAKADLSDGPGIYLIRDTDGDPLYAGETFHLARQLDWTESQLGYWNRWSESLSIQTASVEWEPSGRMAWQSCLCRQFSPRLNCPELGGDEIADSQRDPNQALA